MTTAINRYPVTLSQMVMLTAQSPSTEYTRYQSHVCLTTLTGKLDFRRMALGSTSTPSFLHPQYGLRLGDETNPGVLVATTTVAPGTNKGTFNYTLTGLADGPYLSRIVPMDGAGNEIATSECMGRFWLWVDVGGTAKDHPDVIFQNDEFDWMRGADGLGTPSMQPTYFHARVPKAKLKQRVSPSTWWHVPDDPAQLGVFPGGDRFDTAVPPRPIKRVNFAATTDHTDVTYHLPAITARGIIVTENQQRYFADFHKEEVRVPSLDGPRGKATVVNVMAIWVGHAGSIYCVDSHSFFRVNAKGEKQTFAGIRHLDPPPYWTELDDKPMKRVEIVGNWDPAIPANKRWPWESWGLLFDHRTLAQDASLPTVEFPPFGQLQQHVGVGPHAFCTCRQGRVLSFQFDKTNRFAPPYITEWVTGLSDPWGLAQKDGVLYVAERGLSRISKWSMDTPNTYLGNAIAIEGTLPGVTYGAMENATWRRWAGGSATMAQRRALNILGVEQIAIMDDFLYFSSYAQQEVRRMNMTTGVVEVCVRVPTYAEQSRFVNFAVSDGTFGPRHTLFTTTFDNQTQGRPRAYLPTAGVDTDGTPITHSKPFYFHGFQPDLTHGPGKSSNAIYPLGIGVGNGMMVYAHSGLGLDAFMLSDPSDPVPDYAKLTRGHAAYRAKGYRLIHGNYGWGHVDEPLPWGEDADMDYWLAWHGHSDAPPPPPPPDTLPEVLEAYKAGTFTLEQSQAWLVTQTPPPKPPLATFAEMLDAYAAGTATLADVEAWFVEWKDRQP